MSQISPPLRILLVGSVLFLAAWMLFLRPGGGTDTAAPAPATTPAASDTPASAPGQAVDTARDAAAAAEGAAAARAGEAPATGTAPGTSAAAGTTEAPAPAAARDEVDTKGLPAEVAKAVEARKVLVMLFWNPKAADDRMVRAELRKVDRYDGRVVVHVADVDRIARYAPIAQGVEVEQSPSIVVVDGDRRATLMTGYTDAGSIQQAVADAVGTDALIARKPINGYFKSVDRLCAQATADLNFDTAPRTPAGLATALTEAAAVSSVYDRKFRAMDTPKRYAGFRKQFAAFNARGTDFFKRMAVQARGAKTPAAIQPIATRVAERAAAMQARGAEQFGRYGIASCL
jgi:hypothetical protein